MCASVEGEGGAFGLGDVEVALDSGQMLARDDGAHVDVGAFVGGTDLHLRCAVAQEFDEARRNVADTDGDGAGHAALAGAAEGA